MRNFVMMRSDRALNAVQFPALPGARRLLATVLVGALCGTPVVGWTQQQSGQSAGSFTMKMQSEIVLTNVVVRSKKTGEVVKDLKASDFTIYENGKAQQIASFDYQNVDQAATLNEKNTVTGKATVADILNGNFAENKEQ